MVDGWVAELKRQLNEWFDHNPGLAPDATSFELVASGGAFDQPGLFEYLKAQSALSFRPWPNASQPDAASPSKRFEVAFGAALQALGYSAQPVSLLPDDYRVAWRKRLNLQRLELASFVMAVLCVLLFALGTWHKVSLISRKQALLAKVQSGLESVEANEALSAELTADYESFRPLFACQQNTVDTLQTLALLQQSRSNRSFWYVLLADQQTYFSQPPGIASDQQALAGPTCSPRSSVLPEAPRNSLAFRRLRPTSHP